MTRVIVIIFLFANGPFNHIFAQGFLVPDTVSVHSVKLTLEGLLWRPTGGGLFPTVIFCHGSYGGADTIHDPLQQLPLLGPVFARHGYIFLALFRRGVGLSKGQGKNSAELMNNAFRENGQEGRNKIQLEHLETDQLEDMISGLSYLQKRLDVDSNRMAIVGHSFGGSLTLLVVENDHRLRAAVIFGAAGGSWDRSPQLRARLVAAVQNITVPILIIHAQNDYSVNPGYALDSVMNHLNKAHELKIYTKFGNSDSEGHNMIFLSIETWEADVFRFLDENLKR